MTQALVVNDVIKAQLWCSDTEQASVNTIHYQVDSITGTVPTLEDWLTHWLTTVAPSFKALLSTSAHFDGGRAQIIRPLPLMVAVLDTTGAGNGVVAGEPMARQTSGLLTFTTPFAGPGGRGRMYVPFPGTPDTIAPGIPTASYIARLDTFFGELALGGVNSGGGFNYVTQMGFIQTKTANFIEYTGHVSNAKWATQKRRGSYGRPNFSPV